MAYASEIRQRLAAVDMGAEVSAAATDSGFKLNDNTAPVDPAAFDIKSKTPYGEAALFVRKTKTFDTQNTSAQYPLLQYIRQKLISIITQKTGIE